MKFLIVRQQKSSDKLWKDEAGMAIPYERIKTSERASERKIPSLAKERINLRKSLELHKQKCFEVGAELYRLFIEENGGKAPKSKGKGNITRFNFDRSIKIEINVNDRIEFDPSLLGLAKNLLDEMLTDGLESAKDYIKPIVMDAFNNSKGTLDTKGILGLRKHACNVPDPRYKEAMTFIDQSIRRPESKEYFALSVKDEKGEYVDVHLNFSSI
jgi:hypothetical protein